ncbi:acyl carrier protein [Tindallia californiensis]|uniref:Acyl carrier protein n=1 Tax=Tindallia californiensis TaxID=159292 RepID=A0A1H3ICJ0_9FIRM|nr:acyl carrier protein [Tindallia californiensis]SDY25573.1 acyl carrier protein [Tindallia californiensis]
MIDQKIKKIIASHLGIENAETLLRETMLMNDLDADSLDAVEIIMAIEDEFEIEIPDEMAESIKTIGEIIDYVEEQHQ